MAEKDLPLWFKQVHYQKENKIISNGLTIPYLIGCYRINNQLLNDSPIRSLLFEIIESNLEVCAILQLCPHIQQYVIGIDDRKFCDRYLKKEIRFQNLVGKSSLYITRNANQLGGNIDKIIEQFDLMFQVCIANAEFSWKKETKNWSEFTKGEKEVIERGI